MSPSDFFFTVQLNDEPEFESMLVDLAVGVLLRAGCPSDAAGEIASSVRSELAKGAADGRRECSVKFRAQGGELEVAVGYSGGGEWRISRRLP